MPDTDRDALQLEHIQQLESAYARLLEQHRYDAVLISSGAAPIRYADDQYHHHQGYGHFLHWTGLTGIEHSWLLIQPGKRPQLWLHAPVDFWHATPDLPNEPWTRRFDITPTTSAEAPDLASVGRLAVIGDPTGLAGLAGDHNPEVLTAALDELRVHKSAYEIECIEYANAHAALGHDAAQDAFLNGGSEFEINLAYQRDTRQREADAPYHSIIGVNDHAGILHYQHYDARRPVQPRSLLIDAGVRYRGYCSDITRTVHGPGELRFKTLIDGVDRLQKRLCDAVGPGVDYIDLHMKTHLGIAALLRASDLVQGLDEEAIVETGISRAFYPHGLGHLLGIQVHDVGGKPTPPPAHAPFLRLTRPLASGMVLTIEPGLYFIPSLLDPIASGPHGQHLNLPLIDELKGCGGIRIEDNVLVTDSGSRNLTRPYLPR